MVVQFKYCFAWLFTDLVLVLEWQRLGDGVGEGGVVETTRKTNAERWGGRVIGREKGSSSQLCAGQHFWRKASPRESEEGKKQRQKEERRGSIQQATFLDKYKWDSLGMVQVTGCGVPQSESFLICSQVFFCPLVGFQSLYSVHILRQLWLPSHQHLVLLYVLRSLKEIRVLKQLCCCHLFLFPTSSTKLSSPTKHVDPALFYRTQSVWLIVNVCTVRISGMHVLGLKHFKLFRFHHVCVHVHTIQ